MRSIAVVTTLAFAAGVLLGWSLASRGGNESAEEGPTRRAEAPGPSPRAEAVELVAPESGADDGLAERLDRIERALAELRERPSDERRPIGADPGTADELARLRATVDELARAVEASREGPSELVARKDANPEPDWRALGELIAEWQLDEEAAAGRVRLMSPEDVVAAYGSPTETWSNERGTHWIYGRGRDAVTDEYLEEVYLRFQDGYVTLLGVALR